MQLAMQSADQQALAIRQKIDNMQVDVKGRILFSSVNLCLLCGRKITTKGTKVTPVSTYKSLKNNSGLLSSGTKQTAILLGGSTVFSKGEWSCGQCFRNKSVFL